MFNNYKKLCFFVLTFFCIKIFCMESHFSDDSNIDAGQKTPLDLRSSIESQSADNYNKINENNLDPELEALKQASNFVLHSDGTREVKSSRLKRSKSFFRPLLSDEELEKLSTLLEQAQKNGYKNGAKIIYQQAINAYESDDYYIFIEILKSMAENNELGVEALEKSLKKIKYKANKKSLSTYDYEKTKLFFYLFVQQQVNSIVIDK